ncbi:hypothetical protein [Antarcticimicrobium sediminis]|uniref:Uncharacterized protein n=1 Tax=Antarcticimicrobium sediminis TaxID=2546227 RepID=A0A4R5EU91_9RHOB|nr:hypothetical protein [Antarcticimicrobium sediminis]TDE38424.1 hypothetical protein E1B25_09910 [Antarcticimicrobium sediminis]
MRTKAALIAIFLPLAALAQEPLSVIDWLGQARPSTLPGPVLLEPPVAAHALRPEIEVSALEELAAPLGLVPPNVTGLPVDLWHGSDAGQVARLIADAPVKNSPAMQALFYTLLLAEKRPPMGASDAEAEGLLLAQIDRLIDLGATDPALALAELAGPMQSRALFRRWFDSTLLTGEEDDSCAALQERPYLSPDYAATIFCIARAGDWQTAALTLETAHALDLLPPLQLDLLDRFLSPEIFEGAPPLPAPTSPDPLTFRLYEAIGERLPSTRLPRAFANADLRDLAGWKAQIEAAERLTRIGALNPNKLLGLYTERAPAASGGIWDRVAAVQRFDTALTTGSVAAVAKTLPPVWAQIQAAGLEVPFAHLFADRLAEHPLDGAAAVLAWKIRLLSPQYEAAAQQMPEDTPEYRFLAALAQGEPARTAPPDERARAITDGFSAGVQAPQSLRKALDAGQLGEVILRSITLFDSGARGNPADLTAALATLRRIGLEDTARRAALQLMLIGQG